MVLILGWSGVLLVTKYGVQEDETCEYILYYRWASRAVNNNMCMCGWVSKRMRIDVLVILDSCVHIGSCRSVDIDLCVYENYGSFI